MSSGTYNPGTIHLENDDYIRLSSFIRTNYGIKLPPSKKVLLQCRLQKRLKALNFSNFKQYTDYIFSGEGRQEEISRMIDDVSTNKTDFYREPFHFDFLREGGIRDYLIRTGKNKLNIWSAGCSTGEEPYTIAMEMKTYMNQDLSFDFSILATDISGRVLNIAAEGIYHESKAKIVPAGHVKKYMLKGKNEYVNHVMVIPELRSKIEFKRYNLLSADFSTLGMFDIILCRNVLIYFERDVQYRILKQFTNCLHMDGYLILGHSESIIGHSLPLQHIRPTIFQKTR
jgi:chemotaxis protein methyltransferase CheR